MVPSVTLTPKPVKSSTKAKKNTPRPKTPYTQEGQVLSSCQGEEDTSSQDPYTQEGQVLSSCQGEEDTSSQDSCFQEEEPLVMKEESKKGLQEDDRVKWRKDWLFQFWPDSPEDLKSKRLRLLNRKLAVEGTTRLYGGAKVTGVHFNYKGLTNIE